MGEDGIFLGVRLSCRDQIGSVCLVMLFSHFSECQLLLGRSQCGLLEQILACALARQLFKDPGEGVPTASMKKHAGSSAHHRLKSLYHKESLYTFYKESLYKDFEDYILSFI